MDKEPITPQGLEKIKIELKDELFSGYFGKKLQKSGNKVLQRY